MIQITVLKDQAGAYRGFQCIGHAGYAKAGEDIVCAGASALVINTVNSITQFTGDDIDSGSDEESGLIFLRFRGQVSKDSLLLLKSLVLGLEGIRDSYGNEYISLDYKEV